MLDYLYNAGYIKTFNELRMEAPEVVSMRHHKLVNVLSNESC